MTAPYLEQFQAYRPLMFSIAYRMLGSIADAEDIVQQAYLRVSAAAPDEISSAHAYFSTIVTRLCLNQLQLARTQREQYVGQWLPEPVFTPPDSAEPLTPAHQAEIHDTLSLAFLTLLEQLSPLERAVFLLREVFDYDYAEIAAILEKDEAACRQLLSRARKHIADRRPRFKPDPVTHRQMLDTFIEVVDRGDMDALLQLLAEDVTLQADGGGKVRGAIEEPLYGRRAVSRFVKNTPNLAIPSAVREIIDINGAPSLVLRVDGEIRLVLSLTVEAGQIRAIHVVANPDKLKGVNPPATDSGDAQ